MSSLINRIEISNFLDFNKNEVWSPSYPHVVLDLKGHNTAIQLLNGTGKTTISTALLGLLSRHQGLVKRMRGTFAPKSSGVFTHFRVEMIQPSPEVTIPNMWGVPNKIIGDTYVFGVCGFLDDASGLKYYCFPGRLEEAPVASYSSDDELSLALNEEFKVAIRSKHNSHYDNLSKEDWLARVYQHWGEQSLGQTVNFQLNGGGDASASLYKTKVIGSEKYPEAFFYTHIAPYLTIGGAASQLGGGAAFLDDTILQNALSISNTQIAGEKKEKILATRRLVAAVFVEINDLKNNIDIATQEYEEAQDKIFNIASALKFMVEDSPIPGLPKLADTDNKRIQTLIVNIVVVPDPDEPFLLKDSGFATLLGKEVKHLNEKFQRQKIRHVKESQVLEITCDLAQSKQTGGHQGKLYSQESILNFIDKVDSQYLSSGMGVDGDKEKYKEVVRVAFRIFEEKCDTSPIRFALRESNLKILQNKADIKDLTAKQHELETEKKKLEERLETFKVDAAAYDSLVQSGLFSDTELEAPLKTKNDLAVASKDLNAKVASNTKTYSSLQVKYDLHIAYEDEHPDLNVSEHLELICVEEDRLGDLVSSIKKDKEETEAKYNTAKNELKNISKILIVTTENYSKLEEFRGDYETISESFPEENVQGFSDRINIERTHYTQEISGTEPKLENAKEQYSHETRFYEKVGRKDPKSWLAETESTRNELLIEKSTLDKRIDQLNTELITLNKNKVAPGANSQAALGIIPSDVQYTPLHIYIKEVVKDQARVASLLTVFSSILFAPVVSGNDSVAQVLKVYQEQETDILLPVFHQKQLYVFLNDNTVDIEKFDDVASFVFAGIKTGIVECLLNPEKIAKRKEEVANDLALKKDRKKVVNSLLEEVSTSSYLVNLALRAKISVEKQSGLKKERFSTRLEQLRNDQSLHIKKYSPEVIISIGNAEKFLILGGPEKYAEYQAEHIAVLAKHKLVKQSESDLGKQKDELVRQHGDARDQHFKYKEDTAETKKNVQVLISFLPGGLAQYNESKRIANQCNKELEGVEKKRGYDLDRADGYVKAKKITNEEGLKKRFSEIDTEIKHHIQKRIDLTLVKEKIELEYKSTAKVSRKYDMFLASVLSLYKVAFENVKKIDVKYSNQKTISLLEKISEALANTTDFASVLDETPMITELLNENNFEILNAEAKRSLDGLNKALEDFKKRCIKEIELPSNLSVMEAHEIDLLQEIKEDPERIVEIVERITTTLKQGISDFEQGRKDEAKLKATLAENLASLTLKAVNNLKILRRVLKDHDGGATFLITSKVASLEEITSSIEDMVSVIKSKNKTYEAQKEIAENNIDKKEDKNHNLGLKDYITTKCYRAIFTSPSIKFIHPDIRGGNASTFDIREKNERLSGGQKTSLALLMQVVMARYAQKRKFNEEVIAGIRGQNSSAQSTGILFIDGLFSALSKPSLIKEAFKCIKATQGSFQIVGLIHNPVYVATHDFDIFPNLLIGKTYTGAADSGDREEWVAFEPRQKQLTNTVGFAGLHAQKDKVHV